MGKLHGLKTVFLNHATSLISPLFSTPLLLTTLLCHKLNFYSQSDYIPSVSLTLHSCSINRTSLLLFPPHHFLLLIVYNTVGPAWHIMWPILPNTAPKECVIISILMHGFSFWLKISLFKWGEAKTLSVRNRHEHSGDIRSDWERLATYAWKLAAMAFTLRHESTWYAFLLKHSCRIMERDWLGSLA